MTAIGSVQKASIFIAIALGIYLLKWAQDFIMPMVLALLLTDVLAPIVEWLRRRRLPNALAVTAVTLSMATVVVGGILLLSQQVISLTGELPNYRENILQKVHSIRTSTSGPLARLTGTISAVGKELTPPATTEAVPSGASKEQSPSTQPVPVQIVGPKTQTAIVATGFLTPVLVPLATAGVVFTLLFFFLLERDLVTHRLNWLMRRGNMAVSALTIDQASQTVGRYLRTQLMVNSTYAVLVASTCWLIGLPNAILLGALGGALRYIPYLGPLVGMSLPTLLAIAVFPDWRHPLMVLGCLLVIEVVTSTILEPLLYGSSTGVSSAGVVIVALFWGWMWGAMGLIMAMPLTVWIVLVGRHLPGLRPLAIALSSESIGSVESGEKCDQPVKAKEAGWAE